MSLAGRKCGKCSPWPQGGSLGRQTLKWKSDVESESFPPNFKFPISNFYRANGFYGTKSCNIHNFCVHTTACCCIFSSHIQANSFPLHYRSGCGRYSIKEKCSCGNELKDAHYKFVKIRDAPKTDDISKIRKN